MILPETQARYDRIVEEWKKDPHCIRTAKRLGISDAQVARALKSHGLSQGLGTTRKIPYEQIREVYDRLGNQVLVAKEMGLSKRTVQVALRSLEVPRTQSKQARLGSRPHEHDLPMDEIIARYEAGETHAELAAAYGLENVDTIGKRLRKLGYGRRKGARSPQHNSQWAGGKGYDEDHNRARKIASDFLGRQLQTDEVVHHHNENALDHDIDNLWIFPSAVAHLRYHGKLRAIRKKDPLVDATQLALKNGAQPLRSLASQNAELPDTNRLAL